MAAASGGALQRWRLSASGGYQLALKASWRGSGSIRRRQLYLQRMAKAAKMAGVSSASMATRNGRKSAAASSAGESENNGVINLAAMLAIISGWQ